MLTLKLSHFVIYTNRNFLSCIGKTLRKTILMFLWQLKIFKLITFLIQQIRKCTHIINSCTYPNGFINNHFFSVYFNTLVKYILLLVAKYIRFKQKFTQLERWCHLFSVFILLYVPIDTHFDIWFKSNYLLNLLVI